MIKIRFYGHFGYGTGYGRAATDLALALLRHANDKVALDLRPIDKELLERELPDALRPHLVTNLDSPDVVIVNTLPFICDQVLAHAREHGAANARAIAYTVWESAEISQTVAKALAPFDVIWAPSAMSVGAFNWIGIAGGAVRSQLPVRSEPIYHCVDEGFVATAAAMPRATGDRHHFLWIGKCDGRKNTAAILRTYASAFTHDDPVELTMHMPGATETQIASLIAATGLSLDVLPKLNLCNVDRPREAIHSYYAKAHTYICAAHGEGFNFPAFDAMLFRRHVIAPAQQGSDDFLLNYDGANLYDVNTEPAWLDTRPTAPMTEKKGYLVETYGAGGLNAYCRWHVPDLNQLRRALIAAPLKQLQPELDQDDIVRTFGYQAVSSIVVEALEKLLGEPRIA